MRHSCRFLPPPLLSLRSTARGRTDLHKMGAEVFPLPFSLSPLFPCLSGWRGNCRHGKPSSSESGQELSLSLQRGWLSLSAWKWREREGGERGNHILRVSGTDGHDMPNSPRSLPPLCRNHSPFASASSKWVLSLPLSAPICIAAAILIALITFAQRRRRRRELRVNVRRTERRSPRLKHPPQTHRASAIRHGH